MDDAWVGRYDILITNDILNVDFTSFLNDWSSLLNSPNQAGIIRCSLAIVNVRHLVIHWVHRIYLMFTLIPTIDLLITIFNTTANNVHLQRWVVILHIWISNSVIHVLKVLVAFTMAIIVIALMMWLEWS